MSGRKKNKREVYIHNSGPKSVSTTATNRRIRQETHAAPPRSPEKGCTFDNFDNLMGYSPDDAMFEPLPIAEGPAAIRIKTKAKRYENSDHPVKTWIPNRDSYGDALMRLNGRGPWWSRGCALCGEKNPLWRCEDCFGLRMVCQPCAVERHRDEPLHNLEEWEDNFFQPRSMKDLGLRFQIGHPSGEACPLVNLTQRVKGFVVLENNGIHVVDVDFCGCPGAPADVDQLINIGWYPATGREPSTAATLSLLRRFHTLNLQARVPAYDFYNSLALLRNGSGLNKAPNRLPQFMNMIREYRHLKMSIRAGRLHDPAGIAGTKPGELAIDCRACPHPDINLPEGWEDAPPQIAWIYRTLVSKDANFKMKGRDRSSRIKDPTLGPGWAYVVASDGYLTHLAKYINEDEISHCVAFAALWTANNKRAKGLRASGVGSVSCSRHEIFRPQGTGDLQKGERYSNMDYLFFSSLMGTTARTIVSSYDIACQWGRNFWERAKKMPAHMKLPDGVKILFKVPKFHLPPHIPECHGPYSFNYTKGVGRTDGEGVERNWSWLNWAARFISVMGPGAREDTIDDLCGFSNWKKTVDLGNSLLRKLVLAIPQAVTHSRAFHAFTDGLREGHDAELQEWEEIVWAWEENPLEGPSPYEYPDVEGETMADVMKRLAEEDHARVVRDGAAALLVKPAAFLLAGIEIQEQQAALVLEAKRKSRTTIQATNLQRQRTVLLGKISALHDIQDSYMPGLRQWIAQLSPAPPTPDSAKPETIKIYLPSSLPCTDRAAVCVPCLAEHEDSLRNAQALEGLRDLRSALRTRTFAHHFKRRFTGSQGMYTKSRALLDGIEERVRSAATRYRAARVGLMGLRGSGEWEKILQELKFTDLRGMNERAMNDEEKEANRKARLLAGLSADGDEVDDFGEPVELTVLFNLETGEGHRQLSWIWYTGSGVEDAGTDGKLHPDIRVEWMKARARAERWREELILVDEEMRRVLVYCAWKARWWMKRVKPRDDVSPELAEGLRAYALEQAKREVDWEGGWERKWGPVRERARQVLREQLGDVAEEVMAPIEVEIDDDEDAEFEYDAGFEEEEEILL